MQKLKIALDYDATTNRSLFGLVFLVFIDLLEVYRLQTPHAISHKDCNTVFTAACATRALNVMA